MGLLVPSTSYLKPTASMNLQAKKKLKPELKEVVHKFMTGHDLTLNGKKHDKIEVEVTGTDNANRKYQLTILSPKELVVRKFPYLQNLWKEVNGLRQIRVNTINKEKKDELDNRKN